MDVPGHLELQLGELECRRLLGTTGLGRLGCTERALPLILLVHHTLRGDEVVVSSLSGTASAAARDGAVFAFETDEYDPVNREGWTVSAVGPARLITDPADVAALDALAFAPWTDHPHHAYLGVRIALVQGRRVVRAGAPPSLAASTLAPKG